MAKKIIAAIILLAIFPYSSFAAEKAETERMLRAITPPVRIAEDIIEKKDSWRIDSYYEPSNIFQGDRTGHWTEITNSFAYTHNNITGYFFISELDRFDDKDYTANIGSYISMPGSYVHFEIAAGWEVSYIYKLQTIAEYGHKLYKNLFWQIGYTYRGYDTGDTHLVYPGLIYYFGDSYISADYGVSYIEARDTAQFGTIKGNFAITEFLQWWGGIAFGERLYDIYGLDAHEERGYIMFTGLTFNLYKGVSVRGGYLYGTEKPKFMKHSLAFNLTIKF